MRFAGLFTFGDATHGLVDNGTHAPRFLIEMGRTAPLERFKKWI